jgi:hypothetical protein
MGVISRSTATRVAQRGVRSAILGVLALGVRRDNSGAVVNAVVAFVAAFVPDLLERQYGVAFRPWQRIYAETAMLAHAAGMLGLYDDMWWWDHLTHVLSATLLGGFVHAGARRWGHDPRPRVVAAIVGGGVLWELLEYAIHAVTDRLGIDPVLIPYSPCDTVVDLFFNAVGALFVLAFGDSLLSNFLPDGD